MPTVPLKLPVPNDPLKLPACTFPEKIAAAPLSVPVNVGEAEKTTLPVPVVPPMAVPEILPV